MNAARTVDKDTGPDSRHLARMIFHKDRIDTVPIFLRLGEGDKIGQFQGIFRLVIQLFGRLHPLAHLNHHLREARADGVRHAYVADDTIAEEKEIGNTRKKGDERILFVDDEEMLIELGRQLFEDLGYQLCLYLRYIRRRCREHVLGTRDG